ncbi:hypothetical protein RFI_31124 [Reticulomyxa filosa]|uniref:Uncharacterized protein n=1 Tax=Reticulomyxa filosa TaxID=46433 RepID=X6LYN4_RETFI|nr:hypothetical protein RFI_31124 [Reticulomyxa filosa]|eukprot:ETO06272.1 hypothetical protein RFI_31124 [Reticulomyxa filosa]
MESFLRFAVACYIAVCRHLQLHLHLVLILHLTLALALALALTLTLTLTLTLGLCLCLRSDLYFTIRHIFWVVCICIQHKKIERIHPYFYTFKYKVNANVDVPFLFKKEKFPKSENIFESLANFLMIFLLQVLKTDTIKQ